MSSLGARDPVVRIYRNQGVRRFQGVGRTRKASVKHYAKLDQRHRRRIDGERLIRERERVGKPTYRVEHAGTILIVRGRIDRHSNPMRSYVVDEIAIRRGVVGELGIAL